MPENLSYADTRNMNIVHTAFRREFGLMPDLLASVPHDDSESVKVVADHIRLMIDVLHHHHQAEDAVLWPLLLARAPKETDPIVHLAEGHHQRIETLLDQVNELLDDWAGGPAGEATDTLVLTLRQLAVVLFEHMGLEEQIVLPIVARHVFSAEWEDMEQRSLGAADPQHIPLLLGLAMYEGGEDIVPEPLRADMLPIAPGIYADYAERVYGTRTPPCANDVVFGTPSVSAASSLTGGSRG